MAQNVKNLSAKQDTQVGSLDWIPGLGRFPAEGEGNPFQYSCQENPWTERSLAGYSPWGGKESDTTERLTLSLSPPFGMKVP